MTKYQAIIVSDIHLGTSSCRADEFIDFIEKHPTELLILNGDIIDGWAFDRGARWKKSHTKVISKLLKLSNKTKIIWIRGNHDEFLYEFIGNVIGGIELREDYTLNLQNGQSYYIFHGDVIDVFITKYKWLSRIGSVGYDFALWLNRFYNRYRKWRNLPYYSISQRIKKSVKTATNYINDFEEVALSMGTKKGCDGVMCGHIHHPEDRIIDGKRYINSGDWVENMSGIVIDENSEILLYTH